MVDRLHLARLAVLAVVVSATVAMVWTGPVGVPEYSLAAVRSGAEPVPRLYLARLPAEIRNVTLLADRKSLFLKTMLPVILKADETVRKERRRLLRVARALGHGDDVSRRDRAWLDRLAERYKVADGNLEVLKRRVDIVPPSLALAQAAIESGWGTSRFATDGNALFGMRSWSPEAGLAPQKVAGDVRFSVSTFDTITQSVRHYIHTLNTHRAYRRLRADRARLRAAGAPLDGRKLAADLRAYSEKRAAYVRLVKRVISAERLWHFDRAALAAP